MMGFMELPPPLAGGPTTGSTVVTSCSDVAIAGIARQKMARANKAHLDTAPMQMHHFVWSSAFRRPNVVDHPNRLKAELRTGAVSSCAQVKRSAVRQVESWIFIGSFRIERLVLRYQLHVRFAGWDSTTTILLEHANCSPADYSFQPEHRQMT